MANDRLRRRIANEAARLIFERYERQYCKARRIAARRLSSQWPEGRSLPSSREIRQRIERLARGGHGIDAAVELRRARVRAAHWLRLLAPFAPRLTGNLLGGPAGDDELLIVVQAYSDSAPLVAAALHAEAAQLEIAPGSALFGQTDRQTSTVLVDDLPPLVVEVLPAELSDAPCRDPGTGERIEGLRASDFERLLAWEYPELRLDETLLEPAPIGDRFVKYESLLLPLEQVRLNPRTHPEGDALYHSLQVFRLAQEQLAYDEEFLLAALLHDVGKAIDPHDHVQAALDALADYATERTLWLIEHHGDAHALRDGKLGARSRRRLEESEHFEELMLLAQCDRGGRRMGVAVPDVDEALDYLRDLAAENDADE